MKQDKPHTNNSSGFKVPKGYFEGLEDEILNTVKLKKKVNDSGFKAPEHYFDSLEDTILDNVSEKSPTKVIPLFRKAPLIYASAVAAAVILLFNLSIFKSEPTFDTLDFETLESYVLNENIGSYDIATLLSEDDLIDENFIEYQTEDHTVEDYILDHLDVEDIIIE